MYDRIRRILEVTNAEFQLQNFNWEIRTYRTTREITTAYPHFQILHSYWIPSIEAIETWEKISNHILKKEFLPNVVLQEIISDQNKNKEKATIGGLFIALVLV